MVDTSEDILTSIIEETFHKIRQDKDDRSMEMTEPMEEKKLPTIDIKGKDYVLVKDRVIYFNQTFIKGSIVTEIVKNDAQSVIVKATVYQDFDNRNLFTTGHSEAYREGQMGDVPVEVAETSAVGRALGFLGIGVIESIASADEVNKAVGQPAGGSSFVNKVKSWPKKPAASTDVVCNHGEPAVLRTVKAGSNAGRQFYACARPMKNQCGQVGQPEKFFVWKDEYDFLKTGKASAPEEAPVQYDPDNTQSE